MKTPLLPSLLAFTTGSLSAFPPAPYYTLHGIVRDQTGQVVRAENASVILRKGTVEAGRTTIGPLRESDENYSLKVRIDHARPATALYNPRAVAAQGQFSLVVLLGGRIYYPIEVTGSLTAGAGSEQVRLDLTLGEDTDSDGLPDAWEQWQLFQANKLPDGGGRWPIELLDKDGDFDGDGQSDHDEYIAGTFAGDASERFEITIKSKSVDGVRFEFFAITGKTYMLERSPDLVTWTNVPFTAGAAVAAPGVPLPAGDMSFTATGVGVLPAACLPGADVTKENYRLTVR